MSTYDAGHPAISSTGHVIESRLPAAVKRDMVTARMPLNYEAAKTALAAVVKVDECLDWTNKAAAMATYAKQSRDKSLFDMARRIQRRAEVRLGELLPPPLKGRYKRNSPNSLHNLAKSLNADPTLLSQARRASRVPKREREKRIEMTPPPTLKQLADMAPAAHKGGGGGGGPGWRPCAQVSEVFYGANSPFGPALQRLKAFDAKEWGRKVPKDYVGLARKHVVDLQEWLDAYEAALPKVPRD